MWSTNMAAGSCHRQNVTLRFATCTLILFYFYKCLGAAPDELDEALLCRHCGHEVAHGPDIIKIPSSLSIRQRNDTILGVPGVLIQLFKNPYGRQFEVITCKRADVYKADKSEDAHSFFPSFTWRIAVCPRCGFHLGWFFQPSDESQGKQDTSRTFLGLILDSLLHQDYADSLLITPKSYYS